MKVLRLLSVALLAGLFASAAQAQVRYQTFGNYVPTWNSATFPLGSTDYLAIARGGQSLKIPGSSFLTLSDVQALLNKTIDCNSNTCLNFPGGGSLPTIASGHIIGNGTGSPLTAGDTVLSTLLDAALGNTQGGVLCRQSGGWVLVTPGTSGQFLETFGAGQNCGWGTASGGGSGGFANWPTSGDLVVSPGGAGTTNPTGLVPGTGVTTALAVNVGSAGAFVVNGGALGTPSGGTLTNATGLPAASVVAGALANGMTGTTQAPGDNTTDLATDAFVLANAGIGNVTGSGAATTGDFACANNTSTPLDTLVDCGFGPVAIDDPAPSTVTAAQWANADVQIANGTGILLPASSTLSRNGGITWIATASTVLTANGADVITTAAGTTGAGGNITLAAGTVTLITSKTSGTFKAGGNVAGAVTSVTNSDSSLTVSPTTGAVVASLNAAHANTWSAGQTFGTTTDHTPIPLTDASTIAVNAALGNIFSVTLTTSRILGFPTGLPASNQRIMNFEVTQPAGGGAVLTLAAGYTGTVFLNPQPNAVTTFSCTSTSSAAAQCVGGFNAALPSFTIASGAAQIPACGAAYAGWRVYVTDGAAIPVYNATQTGGGSTLVPVFCDGTNWTNH